ncbi:tRNA guanosine(34) transglycosylase Tgt [Candidatus Pacearchaeota archaeon]|nr:tRNA guanosine(34) transglycosylase Tgt [Candidatus Pacearchaeota archaeon]
MIFDIVARDAKSKARTGVLHTKSGSIETPFFMPVATKMTAKFVSPDDFDRMHCNSTISNAFILSLKPGTKVIQKAGGIGKMMNWKGVNFTDSGGFQMYTKSLYLGSDENGVRFRDPFEGKEYYVTPEKDMQIQLALNADVAMCLDSMPLIEHSKEDIRKAVEKTSAWAGRCKEYHAIKQKKIKEKERQILFGIIQGGIHKDLRKRSARQLVALDFQGYSIGGLALGEPKKDEYQMIEVCKLIIPEEKPVYLMGAGHPLELLEAIHRGVDMFDSRFPTRNARHGSLYTWKGKINLMNKRYENDLTCIDKNCDCFSCKRYSKAYIRYLLKQGEGTGYRLASIHNLHFLQSLMRKAREEIMKGNFQKLLKNFRRNYA